jgi:hypothetical protein
MDPRSPGRPGGAARQLRALYPTTSDTGCGTMSQVILKGWKPRYNSSCMRANRGMSYDQSEARQWSRVLVGVLISAVAACGGQPPTSTGSPTAPTDTPVDSGLVFPLPTSDINACAGVLIEGPIVLEIEEGFTAGRHLRSGRVFPMLWPPGFTARFDPPVWRVVDDQGRPFATSGDDIGPFMRTEGWGRWDTCPTLGYLIVYCGSATCSSTGPVTNPTPRPSDLP